MAEILAENFSEYVDCLIALERLNDREDGIVSDSEMMKLVGI
ncbi:Uncharacterised protein [uncultured archaeon]|nr:Uncharacterised protein [uncultured archaeon]